MRKASELSCGLSRPLVTVEHCPTHIDTCVLLRGGEPPGIMLDLPRSCSATVPRAEWDVAGPAGVSTGQPQQFSTSPVLLRTPGVLSPRGPHMDALNPSRSSWVWNVSGGCWASMQPGLTALPSTSSADQGQLWSIFVRAQRIPLHSSQQIPTGLNFIRPDHLSHDNKIYPMATSSISRHRWQRHLEFVFMVSLSQHLIIIILLLIYKIMKSENINRKTFHVSNQIKTFIPACKTQNSQFPWVNVLPRSVTDAFHKAL